MTTKVGANQIADEAIQTIHIPDSAITTSKIADGAVTADKVAGGVLGPGKNLIINGGFDIWQRGTSFPDTDNIYSADRMLINSGGLATGDTVTRETFTPGQTDVPGNPKYYYKFDFGVNVSNKVMSQRIEDVTSLSGGNCTVSYWAKSESNLTNTFELNQHFGSGGSSNVNVSPVGMAVTSTWQRFSHTFAVPSVSGKTIGAGNYLLIPIIRCIAVNNNFILISQVQVEAGSTASDFDHQSYGDELARCYRYYQRIFGTGNNNALGIGTNRGATRTDVLVPLLGKLRAQPTVSLTETGMTILDGGSSHAVSSFGGFLGASFNSVYLNITSTSLVEGRAGVLVSASDADFIQVDAEL